MIYKTLHLINKGPNDKTYTESAQMVAHINIETGLKKLVNYSMELKWLARKNCHY